MDREMCTYIHTCTLVLCLISLGLYGGILQCLVYIDVTAVRTSKYRAHRGAVNSRLG